MNVQQAESEPTTNLTIVVPATYEYIVNYKRKVINKNTNLRHLKRANEISDNMEMTERLK